MSDLIKFSVQYMDTCGNVGFETVSAVNVYHASDLVRARLPVDEILRVVEVQYDWLPE